MNKYTDDPKLTPGQNELARTLAEEGNASASFTEAEKLAMVASELMDPKEVGLTSAEEARLQLMPEAARTPKLGGGLRLECWVVPLEIRAEWAYQDTKIILAPADKTAYIEDWLQENNGSFRIQARLNCGNIHMEFEQTFTDEVLGLSEMAKTASEKLEALYLATPKDENESNTKQSA